MIIPESESMSKIMKEYKKAKIPKSLREQTWLKSFGKVYENKCYIKWCSNKINVFDYEVGHNIPESKGGKTVLENLFPLCSRCNKSMSNNYTIDEFSTLGDKSNPIKKSWWTFWC
jgi:5-methylcytosine-specific restriction endonuclease McrA